MFTFSPSLFSPSHFFSHVSPVSSLLPFREKLRLRILSKSFYHHIPSQIRTLNLDFLPHHVQQELITLTLPSLRFLKFSFPFPPLLNSLSRRIGLRELCVNLSGDHPLIQDLNSSLSRLSSLISLACIDFTPPPNVLLSLPLMRTLVIKEADDSYISCFTSLTSLKVYESNLYRESFTKITRLTELSLRSSTTSPPPLRSLSKLKFLQLHYFSSHGTNVIDFSPLVCLEKMDLKMRFRQPLSFHGLSRLTSLSLKESPTTLKSIATLVSLRKLSLDRCRFEDHLSPSSLSALTALVTLRLERVSGFQTNWFQFLTPLKVLFLRDIDLRDQPLSYLSNLHTLTIITCSGLTKDSLSPLSSCLSSLRIYKNSTFTDKTFLQLTSLKSLEICACRSIGRLESLIERGVVVERDDCWP